MKRWRVVALAAIALAIVTGLWGLRESQARRDSEAELAARYQQAFFEAVDHVENVEVLLAKGLVAGAPDRIADIFSDLGEQAMAAQSSLTQLPLLQGTLMRTSQFLAQVGDFGFVLARKAAAGKPPSDEELDLIRRMREEAAHVSATLHEIQEQAAEGRMPWEELRRRTNNRLREESKELDQASFTRLESRFEMIPVIQYDGPFSDHVLQRRPAGLSGGEVSEAEAEEIALDFVDAPDKESFVSTVIRRVEGGDIPAFGIAVRRDGRDGDEERRIVLDVSIKGGHVVWMLDNREVGEATINMEEAVERARRFLEERGYPEMVATYATESGNRATIPFVPRVDGILIYPDLLKVSVALDDGRVIGFEALGYLMSHRERRLPDLKITAEEALARVGSGLENRGEPRLALIPTETLDEVLTWEIETRFDGETYLIYINAETGREERILRLVRTGEGTTAL